MLKSGDKVQITDNVSNHSFAIEEEVYFLGVGLDNFADTLLSFVCTNGKIEQSLNRKDFKLLHK